MKKSYAFLTPATKDKAGEVVELEYNAGPAQYLVQHDGARSSVEVQRELDGVVASLPKLKGGARSKADHQVRILQRELRKALDLEETDRRNSEREQERKRQQPSGNVQQAVASAVAAVQAVVGKTKPVQNKLTWESLRADLDARGPQAGPAGHGANTCCEGKYLCSKCQARKAAAVA